MPLVLLADPAHPLAFLDQLGRKWAGAVVPLYVRAQGGSYDLLGVGSGVLVRRDARMFLVTAHHVTELLRVSARVEAVIGEKLVEITGMRFMVDAGEDVAAAYLSHAWLSERAVGRVRPLVLPDERPSFSTLDRVLLLGYPAVRNCVSLPADGTFHPYLQSISAEPLPLATRSPDSAASAVAFHYDPATATDDAFAPVTGIARLTGMSGGPVLHVLVRDEGADGWRFTVRLGGILSEFNPAAREVLAAPRPVIDDLLGRLSATLDAAAADRRRSPGTASGPD